MRTEPFAKADLTRNAFLGGALHLLQPKTGYRAGIDPVLLAASVPAQAGHSVLDMGCGAGAALLCAGARVPGLSLWGVDLQPAYADLCRRNLSANGLTGTVVDASITALPSTVKTLRFDHVMANPPYFESARRTAARDAGRDVAQSTDAPLADWVDIAARRLAPKGTVTFVQRIERMPELLAAMHGRLGGIALWPIAPREGRAARLALVRGRKGSRSPFRCHSPLILHEGSAHRTDGEDYTPLVRNVLRHAAALPFPATD